MALTPEEQTELDKLRAKSGVATPGRRTRPDPTPATNLKNTGRSLLQGATLGFGDEITAGARSLFGEDYDTALEDERGQVAAFNRENPVGSFLTEGLGGLALTGPVGLARSAISRFAPQAAERGLASLGARFERMPVAARTATVGGLTGGAAGFGQGEGGAGDRLANAAQDAAAGVTLGGAVPLVMGAGRGVWNAATLPTDVKAERTILGKMDDDNIDVSQLGFQLRGDQRLGVPATIATQGPNLTSLGEGVANLPGRGMNTARREIEIAHRGQGERITGALDKRITYGDYNKAFDDIDAQLRQASQPFYDRAYQMTDIVDGQMADRLKDVPASRLKGALADAEEIYQMENRGAKMPRFVEWDLNEVGDPVGIKSILPNMGTREWHAFSRALRSQVGSLWKEGKGTQAKLLDDIWKEVDSQVKTKNPDYAIAQSRYSGLKGSQDALEQGKLAATSTKMTPDEMRRATAKMSDNEREMFRVGFVGGLDDYLARQKDGANKAASLVNTGLIRNKLRAITPDQGEYESLIAMLETEARNAAARNKMTLGSPTAPRSEAIRDLKETDDFGSQVVDAVKSPTQFAGAWLAAKAKGLGVGRKTGDEIAPMLFTTDPKEQAQILQRLRSRQAAMKEETERNNLGYTIGAGAFGSAAASPDALRQQTPLPEDEE
jgi:hypothetical protein